MNIIKRDGREESFNIEKIKTAILKANKTVLDECRLSDAQVQAIAERVELKCENMPDVPTIEDIQDHVELGIMGCAAYEVAQHYMAYRYEHKAIREVNTTDTLVMSLTEQNADEKLDVRSFVTSTQRDYIAGKISEDIAKRCLLPKYIVQAHEDGLIDFHGIDYFAQHMINCCLINLEDVLQNGTVINNTVIAKPESFIEACEMTSQIIIHAASSLYGESIISLAHLVPFVQASRKKTTATVKKECQLANVSVDDEQVNKIVEARVKKEISLGIQTIQSKTANLLTSHGQVPSFLIFMYLNEVVNTDEKNDMAMLIEEIMKQRIDGLTDARGIRTTPVNPKLLYVLEDDNVSENSPYWYLTKLAAECSAKRMAPDYISEKILTEVRNKERFLCVENDEKKYYGKFNQGIVTLNLADVGLSANKNMSRFWEILDERLEICHAALKCHHKRLLGTLTDTAPLLWQNGVIARLKSGETIDRLLHSDYSSISLGFVGMCEMCQAMLDESNASDEGRNFAKEVINFMKDKCNEWKKKENIGYSLCGAPLRDVAYRFATCVEKRFGAVKHITDKNYLTNSYHIQSCEDFTAFSELSASFQKAVVDGAVSDIDISNIQNDLNAVLELVKHIYNTMVYVELNAKNDDCNLCGYHGEIQLVHDKNLDKLHWMCPKCGNTNTLDMNIVRRNCGCVERIS